MDENLQDIARRCVTAWGELQDKKRTLDVGRPLREDRGGYALRYNKFQVAEQNLARELRAARDAIEAGKFDGNAFLDAVSKIRADSRQEIREFAKRMDIPLGLDEAAQEIAPPQEHVRELKSEPKPRLLDGFFGRWPKR